MAKVELHGTQGTRTLEVKHPPKTSTQQTKLSPKKLQEVIQLMPRRWINIDEIITQLHRKHSIKVSHEIVIETLKNCEFEHKGVNKKIQVRRHDDGASIPHRKATFAAVRKLQPALKKANIDEDTFWNWIKIEYNVESRTQMDPYQWATLSANLNACLRDPQIFHYLVRQIKS